MHREEGSLDWFGYYQLLLFSLFFSLRRQTRCHFSSCQFFVMVALGHVWSMFLRCCLLSVVCSLLSSFTAHFPSQYTLALRCTVLYCIMLHCTVLYYAALSCTVLYYTALYCTVLYCTVLCCTVLYYTSLYCTLLRCTVLYCTVLYCIVLYFTVLYCTVLYYSSLYCTGAVLLCAVLLLTLHLLLSPSSSVLRRTCHLQLPSDAGRYAIRYRHEIWEWENYWEID